MNQQQITSCHHETRKPVPSLDVSLCISCLDYANAAISVAHNEVIRLEQQYAKQKLALSRESALRHGTLKITVYAPAARRDGTSKPKPAPINTGKTPAQRAAIAEWFRVAGTK